MNNLRNGKVNFNKFSRIVLVRLNEKLHILWVFQVSILECVISLIKKSYLRIWSVLRIVISIRMSCRWITEIDKESWNLMIIKVRTNAKTCFRYVSFDKELMFRYQLRLDTVGNTQMIIWILLHGHWSSWVDLSV